MVQCIPNINRIYCIFNSTHKMCWQWSNCLIFFFCVGSSFINLKRSTCPAHYQFSWKKKLSLDFPFHFHRYNNRSMLSIQYICKIDKLKNLNLKKVHHPIIPSNGPPDSLVISNFLAMYGASMGNKCLGNEWILLLSYPCNFMCFSHFLTIQFDVFLFWSVV